MNDIKRTDYSKSGTRNIKYLSDFIVTNRPRVTVETQIQTKPNSSKFMWGRVWLSKFVGIWRIFKLPVYKRINVGFVTIVFIASITGSLVYFSGNKAQAALISQGPMSASATGDCVDDNGTGTVTWTNPGNAFSSNDTRATASVDGTTTHYIKCTNFGFTIPTGAAISGIVVGVERSSSSTGNGGSADAAMRIVKGGTIGSTDRKTTTVWPTTEAYEDHGSSTDLWGDTWAASDVNGTTFGAAIAATKANSAGAAHTVSVDHVRITVYYSAISSLNQTGYIWENDDDSGGSPIDENSQQAIGSSAITAVKKGERLTLRMQIKNSGLNTFADDLALFYDTNSDGNFIKATSPRITNTTGSGCASSAWICSAVDTASGAGVNGNIAISPDGIPYIAYKTGLVSPDLAVAQYVGSGGTGCTSSTTWSCTVVDTTGVTGYGTSVAFSPDGTPYVSYVESNNSTLIIAKFVGSGGTGCTSSAWTCTTVEDTLFVDSSYTSLSFNNSGTPYISYAAASLYVAQFVGSGGTGCTSSAWTCTSVDTGGSGQATISYRPDDGRAVVAYTDNTNSDLQLAEYVGSGGTGCTSSAWTCTEIDTTDVGVTKSLTFSPSGKMFISYYVSGSSNDVKLAEYVGSGGTGCTSSAWTCTAIQTSNNVGSPNSIAFSPAGIPYISYYDSTGGNLLVAQYVGSGGSGCATSAWTCTTVASSNDVGQNNSIAFSPDGTPYINYYNATSGGLYVAKLARTDSISIVSSFASVYGNSLNESHSDMTAVPDNTNRDDADCIGGGTFGNGLASESEDLSGLSIPAGQCTEVSWVIDTSQATPGAVYRFVIASKDAWNSDRGAWRGPISISAYPTLTIESSTSIRVSKGSELKFTDCSGNSSWGCEAIATTNDVGIYNSLAFSPNGIPYIAYYDQTNAELYIAQYVGLGNGSGCATTAWTCTGIETTDTAGTGLSLAFSPSGTPYVSYANTTTTGLVVAQYVGSGGNGCDSTAWTCTEVDITNDVGAYTSMAFSPSGIPYVSYIDSTNFDLRIAKYVGSGGTGCNTTAWTCTAIDSTNSINGITSIAFSPNGTPFIVYGAGATNYDLYIAQYVGFGGTGCATTAWTCTAVDTANEVSLSGRSLAFSPSGNPYISYTVGSLSYNLYVAQYVGTGGSGCATTAWACTNIENNGSRGLFNSIAFSPNGIPYISYWDSGSSDLRVAKYVGSGGTGCGATSTWDCIAADTSAAGRNTSIAFNQSGTPYVSHYDWTGLNLRISKLHDPPEFLSTVAQMTYPGRSGSWSDALFHLDSGYSPRTSTCSANTDLKGYCGIAADDSDFDGITATNARPIFNFAVKNNNPSSIPTISWVGRSNIAPSTATTTGDIKLQVYNFSTKLWEDWATDSTSSNCSTADCSLSASVYNVSAQSYYQTIGTDFWLSVRVWQYENSSAETLKTDYFGVGFENTGSKMRHGQKFLNNGESGFDL